MMAYEDSVFGIPVNVLQQQDIDQEIASQRPHKYVVMRKADMSFLGAPALKERVFSMLCDKCSQPCWIDPVAFNPVRFMNLTIICTRCEGLHPQ